MSILLFIFPTKPNSQRISKWGNFSWDLKSMFYHTDCNSWLLSALVLQLDTWMIFLIIGQEYFRSCCKDQHLGAEIIPDFWCFRGWIAVWSLSGSAPLSSLLGQCWFAPPAPPYRTAAQSKCLQPLTFRVEGVGKPPGSTTDQSGLHDFPGRAGGWHGDGCTESAVPCAFL